MIWKLADWITFQSYGLKLYLFHGIKLDHAVLFWESPQVHFEHVPHLHSPGGHLHSLVLSLLQPQFLAAHLQEESQWQAEAHELHLLGSVVEAILVKIFRVNSNWYELVESV